DNATLERGQATLPHLQITLRLLGFSHSFYRVVVLTSWDYMSAWELSRSNSTRCQRMSSHRRK
ncbi:MAG: hypothetical protein ABI923_13495, partial [bacterium]